MNELIDRVTKLCNENLPLTERKLKMLKSTPKDQRYMFLPLTMEETIRCWEEIINKFKDGKV